VLKLPADLKIPDLKNNPKQLMIVFASAFVIALIIYLQLLLLPQIGRLTGLLYKVGTAVSDLKSAETDIGRMGEFRKTIDGYRNKVELYEKRLPSEEEIPSLLENLSRMAGASNIQIVGITPVPSPIKDKAPSRGKAAAYKEIPILINARCGYHELGRFMSDLENADRFMKVVDIEIRSTRASPGRHDVELVVCTYILLKGK